GRGLAAGSHGERDELMANLAAYSGLRWGELTALTIPQVNEPGRVITVDRKVVEIPSQIYVEAPKNASSAGPSPPAAHPAATPRRQARRPHRGGARPAGGRDQTAWADLSNADGEILALVELQRPYPAARLPAAGWRDSSGAGQWTWHS